MSSAVPFHPIRLATFSGGPSVPSARLRVHELSGPLARRGIDLLRFDARQSSYPPHASSGGRISWFLGELLQRAGQVVSARRQSFDGSLVHREFVSTVPTLERFVADPLIFDVDDAIWLLRGGIAARSIARRSRIILAGNSFLAEHFGQFAPVEVLPTAVDVSRYLPAPSSPDRLRIGWCGTSSNFRYLSLLEEPLRSVLRGRPDVEFLVMADRPPVFNLPSDQFSFQPWTREGEYDFLRSLSVAVMPLADGLWERGKCAYKMLSAMATGLPVVASPVGMNADLLGEAEIGFAASGDKEWRDALEILLDDEQLRGRLGGAGRSLAEERYSLEAVAERGSAAIRRAIP